jgi:ATP-binding cassette, subfamily B, bacterial MsbA
VERFSRILPFLWPYRKPIAVSVLCAVVISFLWAANLSATLPLVRVLFENKNVHQYVQTEIDNTETEIALRDQNITSFDDADIEGQAKAQRDQSTASERLVLLTSIRDYVLPWVPKDRFDTVALIVGALLIATVLKGAFIYLQEILVGSVVNRAVIDIRKRCFRNALKLDFQTIHANGTSNLQSRMTNDVEILSAGMKTLLIRLIREPLKAGGCIMFAFFLNWRLTLLSLLVVPVLGFIFHKFGRSLKKASHGTMQTMSGIYKCLTETFDSIKIVLSFGSARRHRQQFHRRNKEYYKKSMRLIRVGALTRPVTEVFGVIAVLAAFLPGAYLVLRGTDSLWGVQLSSGQMDMAELTALYALLAGTLDSVRKLSSVYGEMKRASAASERIFEIIDQKTKVPEPESARVIGRHSNNISFNEITFAYQQENVDGVRPPALRDLSLKVDAGEVVAIIGENGSGKSTLVNLLPRFYDPDQGAVTIDGVDIRDVATRELRDQIGVVTQETLLFDDTIFENIRYGKPNATWEEVEEAARQAHVIPFVTQLPDGFDTVVGEKGQKLSGGQRQRIALARAIIRDPAILILDEATSAIDSQSEQVIHQVLKTFVKGRTVFVISHVINDTFLDLVTRVVVLDKGQVLASGPHDELIETCDVYQRLYHASTHQRAA